MNSQVESYWPAYLRMMAVQAFLCGLAYLCPHRALVAKEWEREYSGPLCKQRGIPKGCQVDGRELKHSGNKPGIYRGLPGQEPVSINSRSQGLRNK